MQPDRPAESTPALWACPRCHRVVRGLSEVRFARGLIDYGPEVRCESCVEDLREEERDHVAGRIGASPTWAVEVVGSAPVRRPK